MRAVPRDARPGGLVRGRYELGDVIAQGGMGTVHRARDRETGLEVAFKRLTVPEPSLRPRMTALFQREFATLAELAHPRIIEVHDYGVDADGPFYTMELLSGPDLAALAPLPLREACGHLRDVASALALLHARRLVHRDVTPTNVKLTATGRAKLIDFGALAAFGRAQDVVGTPSFMAPECLEDAPLDQRSDLYSLGALAYWTLTRRRAVRSTSVTELRAALAEKIVPPSHHVPGVPPELEELVLSLLRHDPLARPSTAAEVMERLADIAGLPPEDDEEIARCYLAHPPLAGRDAARESLELRVSDALAGRGSAVSVEAPEGMGRSALLDAVARRAELDGALVLRARPDLDIGAYGVARALAKAAMAALPELGAGVVTRHEAVIGHWFRRSGAPHEPQAKGAAPVSASEAAERRARTQLAVQEWLLALAEETPLVVMLDDAHRADGDSLALLTSLAREAAGRRLVVVAAAARGKPPVDAEALAAFVEDATTLALDPLSCDDVATLVDTVFGTVPNATALAHWLHAQSGGSPFHAMELLRVLVRRHVIRYANGTFSLPHPAQLVHVELGSRLVAQLDDLSEGALAVARILSMHGEALTADQCAAVLERPHADVRAALAELGARALVVRHDRRFAFANDSMRAALAESIDAASRPGLHLRLGRALLDARDAPPELRIQAGFHLLRGGEPDAAAEILATAGMELAYRAENTAKGAEGLEAALAQFERQGRPDAENIRVLAPLAAAGYFADRRLFVRYGRRALEVLLEISGTRLAARLRRFLGGKLAILAGLLVAFVRYLRTPRDRRLDSFGEVLTGLFGVASVNASAAATSFEPHVAFEVAESLEPFAPLGPDHPANVMRDLCLASPTAVVGEFAESLAIYRSVIDRLASPKLAAKLPDEVRRLASTGMVYGLALTEAMRARSNVLELADAIDESELAFYRPHAELVRMVDHGFRGDQAGADAHRARLEARALLSGSAWSVTTVTLGRLLILYRWTRDNLGLVRLIDEAERLTALVPAMAGYRDLALAYVELLRGRPDRALELTEQTLFAPRPSRPGRREIELGHYVEILVAAGRASEAKTIGEAILKDMSPAQTPYVFASLVPRLAVARADAALGDVGAAVARLDALLATPECEGNPIVRGTLHRERASLALLAHDPAAFEHHAAAMDGCFRPTGNPALTQQCEALLSEARRAALAGDLAGPMDDDGIYSDETHVGPAARKPGRTPVI